VATRRSEACSSATRCSSWRASALATAVATSSVNLAIWASVSSGNGSSRLVEAATTPHSRPPTTIGQPTEARIPSARASVAIAPASSPKLSTRTGPPVCATPRAMLNPSRSIRVPTASSTGTRPQTATPVTVPSSS
jgi:hypothetical protein